MQELIEFLDNVEPVGPLGWSRNLTEAAAAHVFDQGPSGLTGHASTDGTRMGERISGMVRWERTLGENISYGMISAMDVVI